MSMAGSVGAEDGVLCGPWRTAWRLTPGGDIAAAATRPGVGRYVMLMVGHGRMAGAAARAGGAECR